MTSKLTPAQQSIVDAMRQGAYITSKFMRYHLWSKETHKLIQVVSKSTVDALYRKSVIEDARRRDHMGRDIYELTPEYQNKEAQS